MHVLKLVKKAKKGNKEALLKLIMDQKDDYFRLAYAYLGNEHDALDAMEDMIVKVYENIDQLQKPESFYSWSKTILVNGCKTMLRNKKKVVLVDEWNNNYPSVNDKALDLTTQTEQQIDIKQLLTLINPNQAEAIRLKYINDLDYQSIAELTNVSVGTVKSRVFQGLKKLNLLYRGDVDE